MKLWNLIFRRKPVVISLECSQFETLTRALTHRISLEDQQSLDRISASIAKIKESVLAIDTSAPKG